LLVPLEQALACFDSVPFNATRRDETIDMLTASLQLYSFLDIQLAPPAPFEAVDILGDLRRIRSTTFASDFRMQLAIAAAYRKLNDAHTIYQVRECYVHGIVNALPLFGYFNASGDAVVGVLDPRQVYAQTYPARRGFLAAIDAMDRIYGAFSSLVAGAVVVSIDGTDPWNALLRFANTSVGLSKSAETRLSLSLTRPLANSTVLGLWTYTSTAFSPVPASPGVTVTLVGANGTNAHVMLKIPYFVVNAGDIDDDFARKCYSYHTEAATHNDNGSKLAMYGRSSVTEERHAILFGSNPLPSQPQQVRDSQSLVSPRPGFTLLYSDAKLVSFWIGTTNAGVLTLVLHLPTMMFDVLEWDDVVESLAYGFGNGTLLGATQLLIDLTGNSGGVLCAVETLLNVTGLWKSESFSDMPVSELAVALAQSVAFYKTDGSPWSANSWQSDSSMQTFAANDTSWLVPGTNKTRGGKTRAYSQLITMSDATCSAFRWTRAPPPRFTTVKIITHGFCGSACAMFVDHASQYAHAETILVGVHDPSNQQSTSFVGGQVYDNTNLEYLLRQTNLTASKFPFVPRPVSGGSGEWTINIRELYGVTDHDTPLEFVWMKPDRILMPTMQEALVFGGSWLNV
jgi:hypothetical protein